MVTVTNSIGKRVYESTFKQPAGSQIKTINMQQMAAGIYFLKVFADNKELQTIKIFKK